MTAELHRERIAAAMSTAAGRWGEQIGRSIANAAKRHCPVDEGRLRASITHLVTVNPGGSVTVRVGSPLAYARYRHEGTGIYGPHARRIVPVSKQALKFRPNLTGPLRPGRQKRRMDGFVIVKSVRGTRGWPFLTLGLEEVFGATNVTRNPNANR
ncbi:HK97 gp10 family phage protein [Nocardia farcinica]